MAFFLRILGMTVIILMEGPGIRGFDKILQSVVYVNILEEYILKSMRRRMERVEYEAEVVHWCLSGPRMPL